jgi:hypothetical protein
MQADRLQRNLDTGLHTESGIAIDSSGTPEEIQRDRISEFQRIFEE